MRARHDGWLVQKRLAALLGVTLILVACSSGASSAAPAAAPRAAAGRPSEAAARRRPSSNEKTLEIAYLSFAVANSYDAPMLAAAQAVAAANNAKLTVFDANLDPAAQTKQLQDAAASGKFDAIITQPLYGAGMVQDVKKAIDSGIAVGNIDQILGADNTTAESRSGPERQRRLRPEHPRQEDRRAGRPGLHREEGEPVQRRLHLVGQGRRAGPDAAQGLRRGHREPPEIKVVGRGRVVLHDRGSASRPPRTCSRRTLTCRSSSGADQAITGAVTAVGPDNAGKIALVGYGGGAIALQGIKSGERYGTVMQMPATEGASAPSSSSRPSGPARRRQAWTRSTRCPRAAW